MAKQNFLEKDLETIIFETDNSLLQDRGLPIDGVKKRQLSIGNYGIADIITFKRESCDNPCADFFNGERGLICKNCLNKKCFKTTKIIIQVLELKLNEINTGAFLQALRYCNGIKRYINLYYEFSVPVCFDVILCGNVIKNDDIVYIADFVDNWNPDVDDDVSDFRVRFYSYSYDFNGISFQQKYGYHLSNEGF